MDLRTNILGVVNSVPMEYLECTNYDAINLIKTNRYGGGACQEDYTLTAEKEKWENEVEKIMRAMQNFGKKNGSACPLFDFREPILLFRDESGQLFNADGQHRLEAAKRLKISFWVVIYDRPYNETIEDMGEFIKRINKDRNNWNRNNFIGADARNGDKLSQEITNVCNKFNLRISTVNYFINKTSRLNVELPKNRHEEIVNKINKCSNFLIQAADNTIVLSGEKNREKSVLSLANTNAFLQAILFVYEQYDGDTRKLNQALKKIATKRCGKLVGIKNNKNFYLDKWKLKFEKDEN